MMNNYRLEGHEPVRCESTMEWAGWYESTFKPGGPSRIVKRTIVGRVWVSTGLPKP